MIKRFILNKPKFERCFAIEIVLTFNLTQFHCYQILIFLQVRGLVDMFLEMKTNRDPGDSGENEVQLCKVSLTKRCNRFKANWIKKPNLELSPLQLIENKV